MSVWVVTYGEHYEYESIYAVYDSAEKAKAKMEELAKERKAKPYASHDFESYEEWEVQ